MDELLFVVICQIDIFALQCLQMAVQAQNAHFKITHDVGAWCLLVHGNGWIPDHGVGHA